MTHDEILMVLLKWNLWGKAKRSEKITRELLESVKSFRNFRGVVVIKGPRRVGKSTLLYQLMEEFSKDEEVQFQLLSNLAS